MTCSSQNQPGRFRDLLTGRPAVGDFRTRAVLEVDGGLPRRAPEGRPECSTRYSHSTSAPLWSVS